MHSYQIGYKAFDENEFEVEESETEFDINVDGQPFENSFYDLWNVIKDYCKDNNFTKFEITYINEVPYYEY